MQNTTFKDMEAFRIKHGWRKKDMAKALHITNQTYTNWLNGATNPSPVYVSIFKNLKKHVEKGK